MISSGFQSAAPLSHTTNLLLTQLQTTQPVVEEVAFTVRAGSTKANVACQVRTTGSIRNRSCVKVLVAGSSASHMYSCLYSVAMPSRSKSALVWSIHVRG